MWQFILTDPVGSVHGEVTNASARKVTLPHLRVPSASFTIPIENALAPLALDTDCLLKAYRTDPITGQKDLAFHGPVVSAEEVAESGAETVAVTAAGPFWRLTKRLIPASKTTGGAQYGSDTLLIDLGTIARAILFDVNSQFTGVDNGTATASTSGWVGKWYLKNVAEAIAELSAGLNSFEYRVRPTEPTAVTEPAFNNPANWPCIGLFDVAPIIGVSQPDAIFEYGAGAANVESYKRSVSRESLVTDALCSVSGWPDSIEKWDHDADKLTPDVDKYHLVEASDSAARLAHGLYEEVVSDAGILDDGLRLNVAQFHVDIRKNPRQLVTFKPVVNARPAPFVNYNVGDTVRARAVVSGTLRFDANFRIWGITFDVDQNGNESVELDLVMP